MTFREAKVGDIPQIQVVRNAVKENMLSDPSLVTDKDCEEYITRRGKGWVCEVDDTIVGFSIADLVDDNIWALFIHPLHEKKGIGLVLHQLMLDWFFSQGKAQAWLSTASASRAELFYRRAGWQQAGITMTGEIKFEMTAAAWKQLRPGIALA